MTTLADISEYISELSVAELIELLGMTDELITAKKESGLVELRQRYDELAAAYGLTPEVVINGAAKKAKRKPRQPKQQEVS